MNERTTAYFEDLAERASMANPIPRMLASDAQPNACHINCESHIQRFSGFKIVRGWLVFAGCWFVPHSILRETASGRLIDITPDPTNGGAIPFVEHRGTEEEFELLRKGRDGGFMHPEPALSDCNSAAPASNEAYFGEKAYTEPTQQF